ncbi:Glycine cleavage H-protein, subgroup [Ostreococcus tauri]|uniref:Glycine cleavage system H protein n=1 Tax=Ostreococcus tauri TaxID=70448 RepID=A0A096PBB7_OSTTA|nr:Glycine cleavage H-protein, subgroup [Ostreococcus tauri]CEG01882.1 Glycine cleavage H-protein, subgroup [Ostreococcus tauri]|eukprot:XP_022841226.1 Glycine cleavage H-protein, subgroup [Ostreococcus tauri]
MSARTALLALSRSSTAMAPMCCGAAFGARALYSTVIEGLKYMPSHEWAKVEGDVATIGITDHAQAELGDIVYVELPEVGSKVEAKSSFGVVESVKAASDVYSPLSGEVVAVNDALNDTPGMVNESSFGEGWLMKVKMSNPSEVDNMMDAAAYEASCQ